MSKKKDSTSELVMNNPVCSINSLANPKIFLVANLLVFIGSKTGTKCLAILL